MKHLKIFETYVSTASKSYLPIVTDVPNLEENYRRLASDFLASISKDYDTRKGKPYIKGKGNCAWFTQEFFDWCETQRIPMKIIYFNGTKDGKKPFVAPYSEGWVIDFTHKQFTKNSKSQFKILQAKDFEEYGYDPEQAEIYDEFPNWIQNISPLDTK